MTDSDRNGGDAPPAPARRPGTAGSTMPGPRGKVALDGTVDPLAIMGELIRQHGDTLRYRTRLGWSYVFTHPNDVQAILHSENYPRATLVKMVLGNGLLASDGPYWREQRRSMQPDFLPARLGYLGPIIAREAQALIQNWKNATATGSIFDLSSSMTTLTLRIIVDALFSTRLSDPDAARLCQAITDSILYVGHVSRLAFGMPVHIAPDSAARFAAGNAHTDSVCYEIVRQRRSTSQPDWPDDLLSLLLRSRQDSGDDRWLRDEMVTMLVGGHETTALALTWAWKEVAANPAVEALLHEELDNVLAGRPPAIDDLPRLPYTRGVFLESIRLYPPVWYLARNAAQSGMINGYEIEAGASVLLPIYYTHRHESFWPDPGRFDPGRYRHGPSNALHRYAYMPFGGGRHQCLGMHLALMEGTLVLAHLAQQCRVCPVNADEVKADPGITLRTSPPLRVKVKPRAAVAKEHS